VGSKIGEKKKKAAGEKKHQEIRGGFSSGKLFRAVWNPPWQKYQHGAKNLWLAKGWVEGWELSAREGGGGSG